MIWKMKKQKAWDPNKHSIITVIKNDMYNLYIYTYITIATATNKEWKHEHPALSCLGEVAGQDI
jgi:hypothetical protein